jgi:hypothetical protein
MDWENIPNTLKSIRFLKIVEQTYEQIFWFQSFRFWSISSVNTCGLYVHP